MCVPHSSPYHFSWFAVGNPSLVLSCIRWVELANPVHIDNNLCACSTGYYWDEGSRSCEGLTWFNWRNEDYEKDNFSDNCRGGVGSYCQQKISWFVTNNFNTCNDFNVCTEFLQDKCNEFCLAPGQILAWHDVIVTSTPAVIKQRVHFLDTKKERANQLKTAKLLIVQMETIINVKNAMMDSTLIITILLRVSKLVPQERMN